MTPISFVKTKESYAKATTSYEVCRLGHHRNGPNLATLCGPCIIATKAGIKMINITLYVSILVFKSVESRQLIRGEKRQIVSN